MSDNFDTFSESDAVPPPSPVLSAGTTVAGKFALLECLGRGGMGEAWLAEQIIDKKRENEIIPRFVLKIVPTDVQNDAAEMDKVRSTYLKIVGLKHTNICTLHPLEKDDWLGYVLVMEYVPGVSLRRHVYTKSERKLDLSETVRLLTPVAEALDYAHKKKIVHRDVKPANIMVTPEGETQLIDFGLAAQIRTSLSQVSKVRMGTSGTLPYMAPEQWMGEYQDAKTDQYALGVVAYELLAGRLPFESPEQFALGFQVMNKPVPPIEGVPDGVNEVLAKAMAKERKDRFESCREFIESLSRSEEAAFSTEKTTAEKDRDDAQELSIWNAAKYKDWTTFRQWIERDPSLLQARNNRGYTPLHIAAAWGDTDIVEFLLDRGADPKAKDYIGNTPLHWAARLNPDTLILRLLVDAGAQTQEENNSGQTAYDLAGKDEHKRYLGFLQIDTILDHKSDDIAQIPANIDRFLQLGADIDRKNDGIADIRQTPANTDRLVPTPPPFSPPPIFSDTFVGNNRQDVEAIEVTLPTKQKSVTRESTLEERKEKLFKIMLFLFWVIFIPALLVVLPISIKPVMNEAKIVKRLNDSIPEKPKLVEQRADDEKAKRERQEAEAKAAREAMLKREITESEQKRAEAIAAAVKAEQEQQEAEAKAAAEKAEREQQEAEVKAVPSFIELKSVDSPWHNRVHSPWHIAFSPAGNKIVTVSREDARIWDTKSGKELRKFVGRQYGTKDAAFSPDGKEIVISSTILDIESGKTLHSTTRHNSVSLLLNGTVSYSPDGTKLITGISADGTSKKINAQIWDVSSRKPLQTLEGHNNKINSAVFTPDNRYVVTSGHDHFTLIWDANSGKRVRMLYGSFSSISPDGKKVTTGGHGWPIRIWDFETGKELQKLPMETTRVGLIEFSQDGRLIIANTGHKTGNSVLVWDVDLGRELTKFEFSDKVDKVVLSPNGKEFVTLGEFAKIWDIESGKVSQSLEGHIEVPSASFSPDGKKIATINKNNIVRIWTLEK